MWEGSGYDGGAVPNSTLLPVRRGRMYTTSINNVFLTILSPLGSVFTADNALGMVHCHMKGDNTNLYRIQLFFSTLGFLAVSA